MCEYFKIIGDDMKATDYGRTITKTKDSYGTSYGNLIIDSNKDMVCEWTLKIHNGKQGEIGIFSGQPTPYIAFSHVEGSFAIDPNGGRKIQNGKWTAYASSFGTGTELKIKLDLLHNELSFIIDGKHAGVAFNNIPCNKHIKYRLAIYSHYKDESITVLQYRCYAINDDENKQEVEIQWSSKYKGSKITLSDNDTKALINPGHDNPVRAEYPISKGMIVEIEFMWFVNDCWYDDMLGVISSEEQLTESTKIVSSNKNVYCLKFRNNVHHFGDKGDIDLGWNIGKLDVKREVKIKMKVDCETYDHCVISFIKDDQLIGSMKLPKLHDHSVWYPVVSLDKPGTWCKLQSVVHL